MTLGCARCGSCCDPVSLDPENAAKFDRALAMVADGTYQPSDTSSTASLPFMLEHWTEVTRDEQGGGTYACDRYDTATRSCTAHESRPQVCRDFPWYGDESAEAIQKRQMSLPPKCSFLLDIPAHARREDARPLIPLTVRSTP